MHLFHSAGVSFSMQKCPHPWHQGLVRSILLKGIAVEGVSFNGISFVPLDLEMHGLFVPFFNGIRDVVHEVDSSHKRSGDPPGEEVYEGILIGDTTDFCIILELGDVIIE